MDRSEPAALNARFAIPGQLGFKDGPGGLVVAEVTNAEASATIALQGAHVMGWAPRGERPVIWLSRAAKFAPGKSIRGGVPVCWPWFGPHATDPKLPGHGYARTVAWEPVAAEASAPGTTRITLRLTETAATRAQWPHATPVECAITVGRALEIELATRNAGPAPVTIGQALHTYFEVGDVRRIAIDGLDGCPYLDKVDGARKRQHGPVTIGAEVDRIYLEAPGECLIDDPVLGRRIRIAKRGSRSTVVWNPWLEKAAKMGDFGEHGEFGMVCVESANAADDVVTVAPGASHRLWVRYSVEPRA
jgi:glucose-6-phosphate 1-epimerase